MVWRRVGGPARHGAQVANQAIRNLLNGLAASRWTFTACIGMRRWPSCASTTSTWAPWPAATPEGSAWRWSPVSPSGTSQAQTLLKRRRICQVRRGQGTSLHIPAAYTQARRNFLVTCRDVSAHVSVQRCQCDSSLWHQLWSHARRLGLARLATNADGWSLLCPGWGRNSGPTGPRLLPAVVSYVEGEGLLHWRPPENPGVVVVQVPPSLLLLECLIQRNGASMSRCCDWPTMDHRQLQYVLHTMQLARLFIALPLHRCACHAIDDTISGLHGELSIVQIDGL